MMTDLTLHAQLAAARAECVGLERRLTDQIVQNARLRRCVEHYAAEERWAFALSPRFLDRYRSDVGPDRVSIRGPDVARAALEITTTPPNPGRAASDTPPIAPKENSPC